MKQLTALLLALLLLAGCAAPAGESTPPDPSSPPAVETTTPADPAPETPEEIVPTRTLTLYLPDEDVTWFDTVEEDIPLTGSVPQAIVDALIAHGAQPEGTTVNSFTVEADGVLTQGGDLTDYVPGEETQLTIDLSAEFAQAANATGTTGEDMLLGSLVNTLLTAYEADTVLITIDGGPLATGHNEYDWALTYFEGPAAE